MGSEEKETDVNVALAMLNLAYMGAYEAALLISAASDLAPVIRLLRVELPAKPVIVAQPPFRGSSVLRGEASGRKKIKVAMLEACLLPEKLVGPGGDVAAVRPPEY